MGDLLFVFSFKLEIDWFSQSCLNEGSGMWRIIGLWMTELVVIVLLLDDIMLGVTFITIV